MTAHAAPSAKESPARRATRTEIASAIDLGWRVAALHALRPTTLASPSPISEDMLLNRRSLSAADRAELELRAIAGVAARAGVGLGDDELARLVAVAVHAGESASSEEALRAELAELHIEFEKRLWATDEPTGKAYELGNFLSDTWNRVLRPQIKADAHTELTEIFAPVRVARMKLILDDLQARIDPVAVHTVDVHLGEWRDRVSSADIASLGAGLPVEDVVRKLEPVERQTIIWRQMLTGDKEPEAWIGHSRRAEVRDEFTHLVWSRYRSRLAVVLPVMGVLGGVLAVLYAQHSDYVQGLAGTLVALAATVGVTRAWLTTAIKQGLRNWGDLMWNRALAAVICRETSVLDELLPPPAKPARKR
jgi:hypothetical protein